MIALLAHAPVFGQNKKDRKKKTSDVELSEKTRYDQADLFVRAVSERERGNLEKALEMFSQAAEMNPSDPASRYETARLLMALGRNDEAMVPAEQAIQLDPADRWYKVLYANLSKNIGNYEEYVRIYAELVRDYPADLNFLNELAFAYYFVGEYQKAIEIYDRI